MLASRCALRPCLAVAFLLWVALGARAPISAADRWVTYDGLEGPGLGKYVVLICGDDEFRSEEALPQLGKILAVRHGFKCTVHFPFQGEHSDEINPRFGHVIHGLEKLADADLMIVFTKWRDLPDEQMAHIDAYVKAGKPILGLRTAVQAFSINQGKQFNHYSYDAQGAAWYGGFGRVVFGGRWQGHQGTSNEQATRGILVKENSEHPILRGLADGEIFGRSNTYEIFPENPDDRQLLVWGAVVNGLQFNDPSLTDWRNKPMQPVAWTRTYQARDGKPGRAFATTLGAAVDLEFEGTRRLIVNAAYWAVGMEADIPEKSNVELVGDYRPSPSKVNRYIHKMHPRDHALNAADAK